MGYEEFQRWYAPGGNGSGSGSTVDATVSWRKFLEEEILRLPEGSTVVDWGCGDWQHSRLLDWSRVRYVGIDVVPGLIERLQKDHGSSPAEFHLFDPSEDPAEILERVVPQGADLVICKDVLQHLDDAEVFRILKGFEMIGGTWLLVNDACGGDDDNRQIEVGACRHLDPLRPPFSLQGELIMTLGRDKRVVKISAH